MRYVFITVGTILAVLVVVSVVGWSLPIHHQASAQKSFRAAPAQLFALITDVPRFPTWRSELTGAELLPDQHGQRSWLERTKHGAPVTYVVDRLEADRLLVSRIANTDLPYGGAWTYELEPKGEGVTSLRITENGEVYNPIFRFVSRFLMGHDATIRQYLAAVGTKFAEVGPVVNAKSADP